VEPQVVTKSFSRWLMLAWFVVGIAIVGAAPRWSSTPALLSVLIVGAWLRVLVLRAPSNPGQAYPWGRALLIIAVGGAMVSAVWILHATLGIFS